MTASLKALMREKGTTSKICQVPFSLSVIGEGKSMNKTHEKVSVLSPLDRLRIERICKNVKEWDSLWKSVEGDRYLNMTFEEIRNFNATLNVIANDTMNTLSSLQKSVGCFMASRNSEGKSTRYNNLGFDHDS